MSGIDSRLRAAGLHLAALLLLTAWLAGCGWQLRGTVDVAHLETLQLRGGSANLRQPLVSALRDHGIALGGEEGPVLRIVSEDWSSRTVSVDERGRTAGLELLYTVRWTLHDEEGDTLIAPQSPQILRHMDVDPARALAADDEERALREEMFSEAALRIMRQLQHVRPEPEDADSDENPEET